MEGSFAFRYVSVDEDLFVHKHINECNVAVMSTATNGLYIYGVRSLLAVLLPPHIPPHMPPHFATTTLTSYIPGGEQTLEKDGSKMYVLHNFTVIHC